MTKSNIQREKALLEYGELKSLRKVSKNNRVSKSALSNWVRKARGLFELQSQKTKSASSIHTTRRTKTKIMFLIFNYVQRFPYTTLHDIQIMLQYANSYLSITTIHRMLKLLRITRKKVKRIVRKSLNYQKYNLKPF